MPISTAQFCVFACDTWRRQDVISIFRCKGFDSWQTPEEHTLKVRRCVTFCRPHAHIFWDFFFWQIRLNFLWLFWQNIARRDKSPSSTQNVRRYVTCCAQYLDIWICCPQNLFFYDWELPRVNCRSPNPETCLFERHFDSPRRYSMHLVLKDSCQLDIARYSLEPSV